jgi:arabinose-5-phosphate isomerase
MRREDRTPIVAPGLTVKDALLKMTQMRAGSVLVADADKILLGIFTDGDFRRHAQSDLSVLEKPIRDVMTASPIRLRANEMAIAILKLLELREIDDIPVVDDADHVLGMVDIQDLPKFKLL